MLTSARSSDCSELTRIAFAAKRHWNYPPEYIERWAAELTISPEYVAAHHVRIFSAQGSIRGFYSLVNTTNELWFGPVLMEAGLWLDHMFIDPAWHGMGIGRRFFQDIDTRLEATHSQGLRIFVDPHAAGFYEKMGAVLLRISPSNIPGRDIPVYGYKLANPL